jgi:hypothetical protein
VAARKRAFAATVTQPLLAAAGAPSVGQPRFAPRPRRRENRGSEARTAGSATARDPTPSHLSAKWLLVGVAIATTIVFVVIKILASENRQAVEAVAEEETVAAASLGRGDSVSPNVFPADSRGAPSVAAPSVTARDAPVVAAPDAAARDTIRPDGKIDAVAGLKNPSLKPGGRKSAGKGETPKAAPIEPPPAPKTEPVAAAPRAPAPRAIETPRDPWQAMNEALSRCAREGFFSRVACEQRLRLQYCANYWGTVPQCPIGPATDHGQ